VDRTLVNRHATGNEYLRLGAAVTLGSRFGDWRVCWLGGWSRHRLFYLVMLVRVEPLRWATPLSCAGPSDFFWPRCSATSSKFLPSLLSAAR
jgi:hypothetical protein